MRATEGIQLGQNIRHLRLGFSSPEGELKLNRRCAEVAEARFTYIQIVVYEPQKYNMSVVPYKL